jgi:hypothetical protein
VNEQLTNSARAYFREAATLRACLEYNRDDFDFARKNGRIIYIFDANIVRFFLTAEQEKHKVAAFSGAEDYISTTAVITAEYLFSRNLAGQGDAPAFISPAHGDELAAGFARLGEQAKGRDSEQAVSADDSELFLRLVSKAITQEEGAAETITRIHQELPDFAQSVFTPWMFATHLKRIYDQDLLRPLALHAEATREILEPDPVEVKRWATRLVQAHKDRKKAERDAATLVQVINLDEAAQKEEAEAIRYVLVTADQTVYDVYARWYWNERSGEQRFLLRLPLQYIPILNAFEMPNGIDSFEPTYFARSALDSLFENLRVSDEHYAKKLPFYRTLVETEGVLWDLLQHVFKNNPLVLNEAGFRRTRANWHECFRIGNTLNAGIISQRYEEFRSLYELMANRPSLLDVMMEDTKRRFEEIEDQHALFTTKLVLGGLATKYSKDFARLPPPRGLLLADVRLPRLFGEETLSKALDRVSSKAAKLLDAIGQIDNADTEVLQLAAGLAHRSNRWLPAMLYSQRALANLIDERAWCEASLMLASATRYGAADMPLDETMEAAPLLFALGCLNQTVDWFVDQKDPIGATRARCERTSLMLTLASRDALQHSEGQPVPLVPLDGFAIDTLAIESAIADADNSEGKLWDALNEQFHCNIITADVLSRFLLRDESAKRVFAQKEERVRVALAFLSNSRVQELGVYPEIVMSQWRLRIISDEEAASLLASSLQHIDPGAVLLLDRAQATEFSKILRKIRSHTLAVQSAEP